ncbi:hypothetical protein J7390_15155 [Xanthomonas phaseoli pv. manihotis]|uniref:Uncharacterized protein n=1 Tax=Xanthomonas manihotis TaxID=43353 RepID=A0A8I1XL92_XANMN|nr:hypothetical protein [Xanthomonas phaseoli pv. manihotis]MBO9759983.1 hypothetical protein [Xanthomonas phaseoli pv. manihotis]
MAFLIVSAIGACIGWVGYSNSGRISALSSALYERELLGMSNVKEANINLIYAGRAPICCWPAAQKSASRMCRTSTNTPPRWSIT